MSYLRNKRKPLAEINVVPYIDVMLVLVIIFMITAPMLTQGVDVKLPEAQAESVSTTQSSPLILSINEKGLYFLSNDNGKSAILSAQAMLIRIKAELVLAKEMNIQRQVLVKGDTKVSYGKVVELMALAQKAGVKHVGLLTKSPAQEASS